MSTDLCKGEKAGERPFQQMLVYLDIHQLKHKHINTHKVDHGHEDHDGKIKTIKLLQKKFQDTGLGKEFLDLTLKAQFISGETNKYNLFQNLKIWEFSAWCSRLKI